MRIAIEHIGDIAVLALSGESLTRLDLPSPQAIVEEQLRNGYRKLVRDHLEVGYVDSGGVAAVITAYGMGQEVLTSRRWRIVTLCSAGMYSG
jgi:hypothetical protein